MRNLLSNFFLVIQYFPSHIQANVNKKSHHGVLQLKTDNRPKPLYFTFEQFCDNSSVTNDLSKV